MLASQNEDVNQLKGTKWQVLPCFRAFFAKHFVHSLMAVRSTPAPPLSHSPLTLICHGTHSVNEEMNNIYKFKNYL